eukprot:jgi/Hompol1/273/HPOL_002466-RA
MVFIRLIIIGVKGVTLFVLYNIFFPYYNINISKMRGMMEFQGNHAVTLMNSMYLLYVQGNRETAYRLAHKIDIRDVAFDLQIQLFIHFQTETKERELAFLQTDVHLDPTSANEFSRLIHQTKLNHFLSLHHCRDIRRLVLDKKYETEKLEEMGEALYRTSEEAEKGYDLLIDKFPESAALYKFYAHFVKYVSCDDVRSQALLDTAEMIEANEGKFSDNPEEQMDLKYELALRVEAANTNNTSGGNNAHKGASNNAADIMSEGGSRDDSDSRSGSGRDKATGRAKESNRIRAKLLNVYVNDMRFLLIATIFIGAGAMGVLIASHLIVQNMATVTQSGLTFLAMLHRREYVSALSLRRLRAMQDAITANDHVTFAAIQSKLFAEMTDLQMIARATYEQRDSSNPATDAFYATPS